MKRSIFLLFLAWGCTETNQDAEAPPGGCEPGEVFECACSGAAVGTQVCADDRTFGACMCGQSDGGIDPDGGEADGAPNPDAGEADAASPDAAVGCEDGSRQIGPCGDGGERTRNCVDGAWSAWSECVEACEEDVTEIMPCGFNQRGESRRTCTDGEWSPWGDCADPDVCVNGEGENEDCGPNSSGTRSRACEDGQWGEFGPCMGADECANGATEGRDCGFNDNGRETRACVDGSWADWGACEDPDQCRNGDADAQACGINNNGERVRTCEGGRWTPFGACDDPDRECENGVVESVPCGRNGRGRRSHECVGNRWGPFGDCDDPDECVDNALDVEACGLNGNGTRERGCQAGQWRAWSACMDPDECRDGAEESRRCGLNGNGTQVRVCADGRWGEFGRCEEGDECRDGATQEEQCPDGGAPRLRVCADGRWGPWSECAGPDGHIRPLLMLCGESERDVEEFIRGPLLRRVEGVVEGCEPDADTQAVLVTRNGEDTAILARESLLPWIQGGGVLITEWSTSHALYTAFFGIPVEQGGWNGNCGNATMPVVQLNPDDPFWATADFDPPEGQEIGCGYDLSGVPEIQALGGWNDRTVSLAYRPLGLGRVWLSESDWQDLPDRVEAQHEPSMDLMAAIIATGFLPGQWPTCWDGLDNDGDGIIDGEDDDCEARDDREDGQVMQCVPGLSECSGECVDLQRDEAHCGGCDEPCDGFCNGGRCTPPGDFIWRGIRRDVDHEQIVGWRQCFTGQYRERRSINTILEQCNQRRILLGCREVGSDTWTVMAMGLRSVLLEASDEESTDHNGARFYFDEDRSMGFAPEGANLSLNTCDTEGDQSEERLCWHLSNGNLSPGWRCGAETGLNLSAEWERAIWTRD